MQKVSLIEFSVENYKIFKNKATFSMVSRKNDSYTFNSNGENLLRTSLIFGPNATGKSTLFEALIDIRKAIIYSSNNTEDTHLPHRSFLGSKSFSVKPSIFEVVLSLSGNKKLDGVYKYSFSHNKNQIVRERLIKVLEQSEKILFSRNKDEIKLGKNFENDDILKTKTRDQSLFLSVAAQFNNELAILFLNYFKSNLNVLSGYTYNIYKNYTIKKFNDSIKFKTKILDYIKMADFCIVDGNVEEVDVSFIDIQDKVEEFSAKKRIKKGQELYFSHPIYSKGEILKDKFNLSFSEESTGTQKFISVLGPIIDTLENGKVLFIDEFDNGLHPFLTKFILDLFESKKINKNNAQLVVSAHDTSLLSYKEEFSKYHFWFTDKNNYGDSSLFSMAEYKMEMRNDSEFMKKYLSGRFKAVPYISLKK